MRDPAVHERTPWPALIAAACRLGVAPAQFWRLSLREWRALVAPPADAAMTRARFEALLRLYPDKDQ
jgi:uncharacterized phage protein (TIGR02216 family)